jgi:hypothetical protein
VAGDVLCPLVCFAKIRGKGGDRVRMRGNGGAFDGFGREPPRKRPLIFSNAGVADRFRERKIKEDGAAAPLEKIKASGLLGFFLYCSPPLNFLRPCLSIFSALFFHCSMVFIGKVLLSF